MLRDVEPFRLILKALVVFTRPFTKWSQYCFWYARLIGWPPFFINFLDVLGCFKTFEQKKKKCLCFRMLVWMDGWKHDNFFVAYPIQFKSMLICLKSTSPDSINFWVGSDKWIGYPPYESSLRYTITPKLHHRSTSNLYWAVSNYYPHDLSTFESDRTSGLGTHHTEVLFD
jgi:hypothetical protein